MVPRTGLEPVRYRYRWILSPLRLPISPPGHLFNCLIIISIYLPKSNNKFLFVRGILAQRAVQFLKKEASALSVGRPSPPPPIFCSLSRFKCVVIIGSGFCQGFSVRVPWLVPGSMRSSSTCGPMNFFSSTRNLYRIHRLAAAVFRFPNMPA